MKFIVHLLSVIASSNAQALHEIPEFLHEGPRLLRRLQPVHTNNINGPQVPSESEDVCSKGSSCSPGSYESGVCAFESTAKRRLICCPSHAIVRGNSFIDILMNNKICAIDEGWARQPVRDEESILPPIHPNNIDGGLPYVPIPHDPLQPGNLEGSEGAEGVGGSCSSNGNCIGQGEKENGVCAYESSAKEGKICCPSHSAVRGNSWNILNAFCVDRVSVGGECEKSQQCEDYDTINYCIHGTCQQKQSKGWECDSDMECMNECQFPGCLFSVCLFQGTCT